MQRPLGVTVLAVLNFLGAVLAVLVGLAFILGMGALGSMIGQRAKEGGAAGFAVLAGFGVVFGVMMFAGAAISAFIGWGLWNLKNWARIVTMVFAVIGLAFNALSLLGSMLHFHIIALVVVLVPVAINGLILWYLNQPHVKQAFSG
jgi:uncharacterized membrane protein (DUF2068 family)